MEISYLQNRNPVITVSRVCGMFMIVLCHVVQNYDFPYANSISSFFSSGVSLFLLISGYLYGQRIITDWGTFFRKRFRTVCFPAIITSALVIAALIMAKQQLEWTSIMAYLIDAEGLLFLNWDFVSSLLFKEIRSLGPLWFTTIIMLCYLLIPLFQRVSINSFKKYILLTVIGVVLVILCPYIHLEYFFIFLVGYIAGKISLLDKVKLKEFIIFSILFLLSLLFRVVAYRNLGGTPLYTRMTVIPSLFSGAWFIVLLAFLNGTSPKIINGLADSVEIKLSDKYSYFVYLSHGVFCMGTFNLYSHFSLPIASCLFILSSIIFAFVVKYLSSIALRYLKP